MSVSLRAICLIAFFGCSVGFGQEKSHESEKMIVDTLAAKRNLIAPTKKTIKAAKTEAKQVELFFFLAVIN